MKRTLYYSFLVLLFIPLLRQFGVFPINDRELDGNMEVRTLSEFNWNNWANGVFQKKAETVATENIGFHGFATRLRNQIDYSFFHLAHSDKAVVGKDNILFDEWYLDAWRGRTFVGEDFIDIKLHKLKMVQDTLKNLGTELIFILAPNKADFYEGKIPDYYKQNRYPQNNYTYIAKRSKEIGLEFIDLNKYFLSIKETTPYPLYPKSGIHWSNYGGYVALDTILNYIEAKQGIVLNDIYIDSIELTHVPKHPDYDIGKNINLLCQIPQWEMAYPHLSYEDNPNKPKPKMLVSGDSYYFNIYNYDFTEKLFANNAFWYYAHWVYPEMYAKKTVATSYDLQPEIEGKDIVLMMVTSRFMHNIDWLLIDKLFDIYYPGILWKKTYDKQASIQTDNDYFFWLINKAESQGIPVNETIEKDVEYILSQDANSPIGKSVFDYIHEMENNSAWLEDIRQKALKNQNTLRDQEILDAYFMEKGYNKEIEKKEDEIKSNTDWFDKIAEKAKNNGSDIHVQLKREAIFLLNDDTNSKRDIDYYINKIKAEPEWLNSVKVKAAKNNIDIEKQIKLEAQWMLENDK
ncbi:MAG: hypothetical protein GXO89_17160 [Chlorobi bacterium]|nr:hypothetical protein [Chlorobiota bacterium]